MPLLRNPTPPRLPDPGPNYTTQFMAALLQVLRLYFSQLTSALGTLMGPHGATFLATAYGEYRAIASQTAPAANTAYPVLFATDVVQNGVQRSGSQLAVQHAGIYMLQVVIQFANSAVQDQRVSVWKVLDGSAVANSRADYTVPAQHGGESGRLAISFSRVLSLLPGQTLELQWSTESTSVSIAALPAATSPTRPASAGVCVALTFISATTT